jgi:hypothetical protein
MLARQLPGRLVVAGDCRDAAPGARTCQLRHHQCSGTLALALLYQLEGLFLVDQLLRQSHCAGWRRANGIEQSGPVLVPQATCATQEAGLHC